MPHPLTRTLAIALACLAAPAITAAAPDDDAALRAAVDGAIRPLMAHYGVPGVAVAVTVDGHATFFNYGLASKEGNVPVSERTLFELGSVSKTFTATLACHAQDLGKLALADHPGKLLPELKGSPIDRATLLDLGAYTAGGLPLQVPDGIANDGQLFDYLRAFQPQAEPGAVRRYSNVSLGLFGRAAARALGADFADAMQRDVLDAMGMAHTFVHVPAAARADYAWGYDDKDRPVHVRPDVLDVETYGIKSSASDMVRYLQANIDPTGLPAPVRGALDCTHVGHYQVGPMVQGLGWEQYRTPLTLARLQDGNSTRVSGDAVPVTRLRAPQPAPAGTLLNKTGSTRGFGAYAAFVPSQRIGVVILANKNYPVPARVEAAYAILAQLAHGEAVGGVR